MQDWLTKVKGQLNNEMKEKPGQFDLQDCKYQQHTILRSNHVLFWVFQLHWVFRVLGSWAVSLGFSEVD
jgi:hypothetical protein